MYSSALKILSWLFVVVGVTAYPTGPPEEACDDMSPQHGVSAQDPASSPFKITVNTTEFCPGDTIAVTISDAPFKGFFIQARELSDAENEPTTHVGNFKLIPGTKFVTCNNFQAISHSSRWDDATSVTVNWVAPDVKAVQFVATVVQDFNTFWVAMKGSQANQIIVNQP